MKERLPVTYSLVGLSVVITLLAKFGDNYTILAATVISTKVGTLEEILSGELYRLFTPAFIHFSIYHLVFNLLWVWILGGAIERIQGKRLLLLIFAVSAALSNIGEFYVSGPLFGGMSGVVYAFFGYVWMQSIFNPRMFGRVMPPAVVPIMLIWFAVCWTGLIGNIANVAHTTGLIIGLIWGRAHTLRLTGRI